LRVISFEKHSILCITPLQCHEYSGLQEVRTSKAVKERCAEGSFLGTCLDLNMVIRFKIGPFEITLSISMNV